MHSIRNLVWPELQEPTTILNPTIIYDKSIWQKESNVSHLARLAIWPTTSRTIQTQRKKYVFVVEFYYTIIRIRWHNNNFSIVFIFMFQNTHTWYNDNIDTFVCATHDNTKICIKYNSGLYYIVLFKHIILYLYCFEKWRLIIKLPKT